MKKTDEMTHDELVASALASPARRLYMNGERDIDVMKDELRARAKASNEERQIVELALGYLDDPEFFSSEGEYKKIKLPPVGY